MCRCENFETGGGTRASNGKCARDIGFVMDLGYGDMRCTVLQ